MPGGVSSAIQEKEFARIFGRRQRHHVGLAIFFRDACDTSSKARREVQEMVVEREAGI